MNPDDTCLRRLMRLAQQGDRAAYHTLLIACQAWLRRYFARRVPGSQLEDLVQDTLASIHAKRATYDPDRPFLPWLAAVARYRWVDHLRRVYRSKAVEFDETACDPDDAGDAASVARISLERMLVALPARQAEAIRLTKIEELSVAEASAESGQSPSLIKVNVYRGMLRLHSLIEKE